MNVKGGEREKYDFIDGKCMEMVMKIMEKDKWMKVNA